MENTGKRPAGDEVRPAILSPVQGETVPLMKQELLDFIAKPEIEADERIDWLHLKEQGADLTLPDPVVVTYRPAGCGTLLLSAHPDLRGAREIPASDGRAELYDLLVGQTYWCAVRTDDGTSDTMSFTTSSQPPRWIRIDGCRNCRDIGGWRTADGRRVKQGMICRTSELDRHVAITEEGKKQLLALGLRTELDIRGLGDPATEAMAGTGIRYRNVPLAAYGEIFTDEQKRRYGESYRVLLEEDIYPIYTHCWGGIDRTGTWVFLLNGMLGVSEDDLAIDYELSSFTCWGKRSRNLELFRAFRDKLSAYGTDLRLACTAFMEDCGIKSSEIERIREILLD